MQALSLKPSFGWLWIRAGWRLFRGQPFAFIALLFFYWLLLLSASAAIGLVAEGLSFALPFLSSDLIATVGGVLVAILTPALTVGFMQACRNASAPGGLPAHPLTLFAPFRLGRRVLRSLLALGAIQVVALVLIVLASGTLQTSIDGATTPKEKPPAATAPAASPPSASTGAARPAPATPASGELDEATVRREAFARLMQGLLYMPIALLMWYAPILAAWHGLPAGKALFFSMVAVWRNLGPFVVYGLGWAAIWIGLSLAFGLLVGMIGSPNLATLLAVPLVMLLLTWMYCSMYPTYASVFVSAEPAVDPATD